MSRAVRHFTPVAVGMLAATGGLAGASVSTAGPAHAAACGGSAGVTVVVDYKSMGGTEVGCDSSAGGYAADSFADAGFTLTRATTDQSFVCRVNGRPGPDAENCVDAASSDRYWSLWVSDGKSGTWSYATRGVDALRVPEGGYVAFSWNVGGDKDQPGVRPTPRQAAAAPPSSAAPSPRSTKGSGGKDAKNPGSRPTKGAGGVDDASAAPSSAIPSASDSTSASATTSRSASPSATASTSAEPTPTEVTSSATAAVENVTSGPTDHAAADDAGEGGLPIWLAGLLAAVVLGAAGAVPILRSRR